jgi:hypothetical protein
MIEELVQHQSGGCRIKMHPRCRPRVGRLQPEMRTGERYTQEYVPPPRPVASTPPTGRGGIREPQRCCRAYGCLSRTSSRRFRGHTIVFTVPAKIQERWPKFSNSAAITFRSRLFFSGTNPQRSGQVFPRNHFVAGTKPTP